MVIERRRLQTILVVDDDHLVRRLLLRQLSHLGFECLHEASSAAHAIDLLQLLRPRLVLTDWAMETSNAGLAVARTATAEHIPVAIVSGQSPSLPDDLAHVRWLSKGKLTLALLECEIQLLLAASISE